MVVNRIKYVKYGCELNCSMKLFHGLFLKKKLEIEKFKNIKNFITIKKKKNFLLTVPGHSIYLYFESSGVTKT